jgi:peptidoglycan hydrolase-like protein with peptidoglycan-binding domain
MVELGIDEAFSWSDPVQVKADGYSVVLGYISDYPGKNWTTERIAACHNAGLGCAAVWENGAADFLGGKQFGLYAGERSNYLLNNLGWPTSGLAASFFCAVDFDCQDNQLPTLMEGLHAADQVGPRRAGGYGSVRLTQAAFSSGLPAEWQAQAWSGSVVGSAAGIYQRVSHTLPGIVGADPAGYDEDVIISHIGIWYPGQVIPEANTPPVIMPPTVPGGFDVAGLPLLQVGSKGQAVRNFQGLLLAQARQVTIDGDFGPATESVLKAWQQAAGLTPDGVVGNATWGYILHARVG